MFTTNSDFFGKYATSCRILILWLHFALRYFAGGNPLDLKLIYDISEYTFWQGCVWPVVDAINKYLDNIHFPINDPAALAELEADFASGTKGGFWRGQVGAIDGVHFKMKCPTANEVQDAMRYHISRKDMYAMLAVAICDYHRRFTWVDISHASCTHDSTAWSATPLGEAPEAVEGGGEQGGDTLPTPPQPPQPPTFPAGRCSELLKTADNIKKNMASHNGVLQTYPTYWKLYREWHQDVYSQPAPTCPWTGLLWVDLYTCSDFVSWMAGSSKTASQV